MLQLSASKKIDQHFSIESKDHFKEGNQQIKHRTMKNLQISKWCERYL